MTTLSLSTMPNGFVVTSTTLLRRSILSLVLQHSSNTPCFSCAMSAKTNGVAVTEAPSGERKLKILMLHGYTQSGPLFHAKTRSLEKNLMKAFPAAIPSKKSLSPLAATYPGGIQLIYPTAPIRLLPADIPGYIPPLSEDDSPPDAWGWWRRETGGEKYLGIESGLQTIATTIREANGVDAVIGFSQGAAAAALVASLLEAGRAEEFAKYRDAHPEALEYPDSFASLTAETGQRELRFAVSYSGFFAPSAAYTAFYSPPIKTKLLHVIGSLDSVVEESRSTALVDACVGGENGKRLVFHPGGHFVPVGKDMVGVLVGFIRECYEEKNERGLEDMDVPH